MTPATGRFSLRIGVWSSSTLVLTIRRFAASTASRPTGAAISRLVGTVVQVATWPQIAAPAALAPMMAIWYIDMPRARTQSGNPIWADTLSELAVVIQATPEANIARLATTGLGASATVTMPSEYRAAPRATSPSRDQRWRRRGRTSTAEIAPAPIEASNRV